MPVPAKYLNAYRNLKGRYDFMLFLCKWDSDYRKELAVTLLALLLFCYGMATWHSVYDLVAVAAAGGILFLQLGGEMSIVPADYRPSHGGVKYTAQAGTHIAHGEQSFLMSGILPPAAEERLGFANPIAGMGLCRESPLASNTVDDALMLRKAMPYRDEVSAINYIRSRHQLRYIAIRVANRLQHTTNGVKLALDGLADSFTGEDAVPVCKSYYFDSLMTEEAFRSRIFRNNIQGEKELYTDLTGYFPVAPDTAGGQDAVRFRPDFYRQVSGHIGITTLLVTENRRIAMLYQGSTKAIGSHTVTLGGSGSMNYSDLDAAACPHDLREAITYGMAREMCEETGMEKYFGEVRRNTMLTGFFRWVDRCGKPEFVGITRAEDVPFSKERAIDGDEVVRYEELPVTINTLKDFQKALAWIANNKVNISLSSLMALHRMTVIAAYGAATATEDQRRIHQKVSEFLFGSLAYLDKSVAAPYLLDSRKG